MGQINKSRCNGYTILMLFCHFRMVLEYPVAMQSLSRLDTPDVMRHGPHRKDFADMGHALKFSDGAAVHFCQLRQGIGAYGHHQVANGYIEIMAADDQL